MTEAFSFLNSIRGISGIRAHWVEAIGSETIYGDRDSAMKQLRKHHELAVRQFAGAGAEWWRAEQVHGTDVAIVPGAETTLAADGLPIVPGVDGLITQKAGIVLAIYVADCAAVWLADQRNGAIGLLHSGKKGTEGNIIEKGIRGMIDAFGSRAQDIVVVLSPCIRPPDYEVDFATDIQQQARAAGVARFHDCGLNTAADRERFYSYRRDLGRTGRMMALIMRDEIP